MTRRHHRIEHALKDELALAIQEIKEDEYGLVTISGVQLSSDFKKAKVWFCTISNNLATQQAVAKLFEAKRHWLSQRVARQLRLKHTPNFSFEFDRSFQNIDRLNSLLLNDKNKTVS